jgi:CHAT domain-containing protein
METGSGDCSFGRRSAILEHSARAASGKVELRTLPHASIESLIQTLREFRPHVFHFSGHGVFRDGTGHLVFEADSGEGRLVPAENIAVLLHDYDVLLALLNGCDTGVSSTNDAVSSVSGALVKAGVSAVVATMREVPDEEAMLFTREFYRSFLAGFTVENSIAEARKALSLDLWDWAAYALFVGSADLNSLRMMTTVRSDRT